MKNDAPNREKGARWGWVKQVDPAWKHAVSSDFGYRLDSDGQVYRVRVHTGDRTEEEQAQRRAEEEG